MGASITDFELSPETPILEQGVKCSDTKKKQALLAIQTLLEEIFSIFNIKQLLVGWVWGGGIA